MKIFHFYLLSFLLIFSQAFPETESKEKKKPTLSTYIWTTAKIGSGALLLSVFATSYIKSLNLLDLADKQLKKGGRKKTLEEQNQIFAQIPPVYAPPTISKTRDLYKLAAEHSIVSGPLLMVGIYLLKQGASDLINIYKHYSTSK